MKNYLKENSFYIKNVLAIALPTIADMFVQTILGFFDMSMVGKIGPEAINAVGIGNSPLMLLTTVFFALSTGSTAIVSRAYGAGNKEEGKKSIVQSILLALPISLFLATVFFIFGDYILLYIGKEGNVSQSSKYFNAVIAGLPFLGINIILSAIFRAVGNAKIPMYTNIISVITNIILNYLLIFVIPLGVMGAGIATTLARFTVTLIYLFVIFIKKEFWIKFSLKDFFWDKHSANRILKVGVPAALEQGLFRIGMLTFEVFIIRLGTISYASHKIASTAESFSFNIGLGFAAAATSLVGQQLGKKSIPTAEKYVKLCTVLAIVVMTCFGVIFLIFPHQIISLFTKDVEILSLASKALWIVSFCQPFLAAAMVLAGSLRGAGATKSVLFITGAGMYLIRVPITFFLLYKLNTGLLGAWAVMTLDLMFRSSACFYIFKKGNWRNLKI